MVEHHSVHHIKKKEDMKEIFKLLTASACMALMFLSCRKTEDIKPVFVVTPEDGVLTLEASGEAASIGVKTNVKWTAVSNNDWISIDKTEGVDSRQIAVTATQNIAKAGSMAPSRTGSVTVSGNGQKVEIQIVQKAEAAVFDVVCGSPSVSAEGGIVSVKVTSNVAEYSVKMPEVEWISRELTKASLVENLSFIVNANTGAARSADIVFTPSEGKAKTITISQAAGQNDEPGPGPGPGTDPVFSFSFADLGTLLTDDTFGKEIVLNGITWVIDGTVVVVGSNPSMQISVTDGIMQIGASGGKANQMGNLIIKAKGVNAEVKKIEFCTAKSGDSAEIVIDHISVGGVKMTPPENVILPKKDVTPFTFTSNTPLKGDIEIELVNNSVATGGKAGFYLGTFNIF